jgi:hypothetical protein
MDAPAETDLYACRSPCPFFYHSLRESRFVGLAFAARIAKLVPNERVFD